MKSRIAIICVALASVFFIACPMPHAGVGTSKDATGSGDQTAPQATGGSISVVNDETRGQAVYINETGQRFDVAAPEYPGGPLVSCVEMADFTLVPPSTDDPLPVKALVAGTRNDGTPGVWEIHSDDTIDLPQPAVDDSGSAKCIVGGDMNTLPDGVQIRYGWGFHVTAVSKDGKMLVGYADNPKGVTIGGVQISAGTTIGVYWRVYSLAYSRFCIVSPPRIIGSFTPQPLPPKWAAHWPGRSPLLQKLWQYISGTLQSYLVTATSVSLDVPQGITVAAAQSTGSYDVMGTDQDGVSANATIDKNGGVTIQPLVPDLIVSGVTLSISSASASASVTPVPVSVDDHWSVSATLTNQGTAQATSVIAQYWLSTTGLNSDGTFDTTKALKLIDTAPAIQKPVQVGDTITITSPQTYTLSNLGVTTQGNYYIVVTVRADPKNGEIDLSDNQAQVAIAAQLSQTSAPILTVSVSNVTTPVDLLGTWSFNAIVKNSGTASSTGSTLTYNINGMVKSATTGTIGPNESQTISLSGRVLDFASAAGTYAITVTDGTSTANSTIVVTTYVDLAVSVTQVLALHVGETWTSTATVTNMGSGTAGQFDVEYIINGQATPLGTVTSLARNASASFGLAGTPAASGTYHVTVIADASNAIAETNKANNTADLAIPVIYDEIVLDTYDSKSPGSSSTFSTYMELWSADGTTLLGWDNSGNSRPGRLSGGFAYIDTTQLAPGDYYVLVRETPDATTTHAFGYAIRVMVASSSYGTAALDWGFTGYATESTTDLPVPSAPLVAPGAPPASFQTMVLDSSNPPIPTATNHLNRYLVAGGVNWIKITLP